MGIMSTYHGCNSPVYNVHKTVGVHYTQENTVVIQGPAEVTPAQVWLVG